MTERTDQSKMPDQLFWLTRTGTKPRLFQMFHMHVSGTVDQNSGIIWLDGVKNLNTFGHKLFDMIDAIKQ